jgi:hypothetical protein
MVVRIFRLIWFLSVLAVLIALLYHYAYLPEEVVVGQRDVNFITLGRDTFFYITLSVLALINVTVFVVKALAGKSIAFQAWFYGFVGVINFFLIIALSFIMLFNSSESYNFSSIRVIIYGSVFLVGAWFMGGIFYWLIQKSTGTLSKSN